MGTLALTGVGVVVGVLWAHAEVLIVLLPLSFVAMACGALALTRLDEYAALRRLQRLAMTALPVTPMVMRLRHHDTVSTGGSYAATSYPITEYWADLWHPQGIAPQPSPRASGSTTPMEEPVAPARPQPDLRVRLREPTDAELPLEVDLPVEVLGTPEHRQWVLILTATRILWPLGRAERPPAPRSRARRIVAWAAAALGVALATVVTVTEFPGVERRSQPHLRKLTTDERSKVYGILAGSVDRYSKLLARGDRILGSIPYPDATARMRHLADPSSPAGRWRDFRKQAPPDFEGRHSAFGRASDVFHGYPDPLGNWNLAMSAALRHLRMWEETATSWQIGEVPRSTRDLAEAKVKRDLAKAMSYALKTARSDHPTDSPICADFVCSIWDFIVVFCGGLVLMLVQTVVIAIGGDDALLGLFSLVLMVGFGVVFGAVIYHWVGLVPMAVLAVVVLGVWLFLSRLSR